MTIPTTASNTINTSSNNNECIEVEAIPTSPTSRGEAGSYNHRIQNAKNNVRSPNIAMIVPRGYKLRDEFVCPITKELIVDPVIAADGHTYDRRAIEEWFYGLNNIRNNNSDNGTNNIRRTSPKTGEPLDHIHLIPNHNLKRLLGDMIREGGEGLYCPEDGSVVMKNTNSSVFSAGNMSSTVVNGVNCNSSRLSNSMRTTLNQSSNRSVISPPSTVVLGGNNGIKDNLNNMNISREDEDEEGVEVMTAEDGEKPLNRVSNQKNKEEEMEESNSTDKGPRLALVRELVLTAKCLGPPESDWNGRSFRLSETSSSSSNEYGCIQGGRRRPNENINSNNNNIDFVQFSDATVSRKHFEIRFLDDDMLDDVDICNTSFVNYQEKKERRLFCLRDLGSAGGTFVRIPPGKGLSLYPGSMIMLGKHQFVVQADNENANHDLNDLSNSPNQQQEQEWSNHDMIAQCDPKTTPKYGEHFAFFGNSNNSNNNNNSANIIKENDSFENSNDLMDNDIIDTQGQQMTEEITTPRNSSFHGCSAVPCFLSDASSILSPKNSNKQSQSPLSSTQNSNIHNQQQQQLHLDAPIQKALLSSNQEQEGNTSTSSIYLKCFAPEGTPIQNKQYNITKQHGLTTTLGRKQTNDISFSHRITNASATSPTNATNNNNTSPRYSFVGIDSSISGEHATIQYCEEKNILQLYDGVKGKSSTNGTWLRLSPMYKGSQWFPLLNKTEILIGTIRFQICIEEVVVERDIYD